MYTTFLSEALNGKTHTFTLGKGQVAVGISFRDMLEWTFTRGESLQEHIEKVAIQKLEASGRIDRNYQDLSKPQIIVEDDDIEVVYTVTMRGA